RRAAPRHHVARRLHLLVGAGHGLLGLVVDALDERAGVALHAHLLHGRLRLGVVGPLLGDLGGQPVRQPLAGVVGDFQTIQAAHVAGGAGRDGHLPGGQLAGGGVEVQEVLLGGEHDAVLGLVVDLQLRVVGAHVALPARRRQPGDGHRRGVPGVAGGAVAHGAVVVGPADRVALDAAAGDGRRPLQFDERVGRPLAGALVVLLGKGEHVGRDVLLAVDGRPRRDGVPAAQELLVLVLVAGAAVAGRHLLADDEAVVVLLLLPVGGLVALQAGDPLPGV